MKKILISTILVLSLACSAFAFSWSGVIDNNSKMSANDDFSRLSLLQSNGLFLSATHNLTETGNMRLAAEGMYKYFLNVDMKVNKTTFKNVADLDLLKFSGDWMLGKGAISLSAGRYQFSDYSGSVFAQASDGAYVSYNSLKVSADLYAGYTGLLNRLNVSMTENESKDDDQFYALCPGYVPLLADISYKALFETNTVGLQAACFLPVSEKNTMKAYATVIANGYLGTIASYDARFTAGTEKFESLMLDAKLDANIFILSSLMASLGCEYVSGEQGSIKPFLTISSRAFGSAPVYNGVIVPKLGVMFASGNFYGSLTERAIISMPKDEAKLHGFDTALSLAYKVFSDLLIGCDAGAYICTETKELSNYSATIKASLSF